GVHGVEEQFCRGGLIDDHKLLRRDGARAAECLDEFGPPLSERSAEHRAPINGAAAEGFYGFLQSVKPMFRVGAGGPTALGSAGRTSVLHVCHLWCLHVEVLLGSPCTWVVVSEKRAPFLSGRRCRATSRGGAESCAR